MEALRSPTRMRIMAALVAPATVAEISERIGVPVTGLYHHIEQLIALGMIEVVGTEKHGRTAAVRYRATATDFAATLPDHDRTAVRHLLADAERDAVAAGSGGLTRIGRTVAAVPPEVAELVADMIEAAAQRLRESDRDQPDPLVSLTYILAPLAPIVRLRPGTAADIDDLRRLLYEAVAWDPERRLPSRELVVAHPELARYHEGWGRRGDLAVLAESGGAVIGGALCRLFTSDDHGHGYLDDATPELAVAVWAGHRGAGIGTRLLAALEAAARSAGFTRLSLSVDTGNPARRLYLRCGYVPVSQDEDGIRMVKELGPDTATD